MDVVPPSGFGIVLKSAAGVVASIEIGFPLLPSAFFMRSAAFSTLEAVDPAFDPIASKSACAERHPLMIRSLVALEYPNQARPWRTTRLPA